MTHPHQQPQPPTRTCPATHHTAPTPPHHTERYPIDAAGRDLHSEATQLRTRGPAVPVQLPDNIHAWAIVSHHLLKQLLTDDRVSKDPRQHWPAWQRGEHHDSWIRSWVGVSNMDTAYGTDHRRLRRLVAPAFTARRTRDMQTRIARITDELLTALATKPPHRTTDLRTEFAHPLPMRVICELFGVPEHAREELATLLARAMDTASTPQQATATAQAAEEALRRLVADKRTHPADDLTSALVRARDDEDGSGLTEQELLDTLLLVIGAGNETTVNLIGNAAHALLTHPEQLAAVRTGEIAWNAVIEETLRWAPSVANVPLRYAVEDIPLPHGPVIRRGDAILAGYAAAARDPGQHGPTAHLFDARRPPTEHISFGHGVHFCPGAPLARLEALTALPALFERFPDLHLATPPELIEPAEGFIAYGHAALPVRLTAQP